MMADSPESSSGQHSDIFNSMLFQQPHSDPLNSPQSSLSHSQLAFLHSDPHLSHTQPHTNSFNSMLFQQPYGNPSNSPQSSLSHFQLTFPHSGPRFSSHTQPCTPPSHPDPSSSYIQFKSSSLAHLHVPLSYSNPSSSYIQPVSSSYINSQSSSSYIELTLSSVPQFEQPHPYNTNYTNQLSGQVPPAVQNTGCARAVPYILPGIHFVPAYIPLRPDKQVRGGVVTTGVF